MKKQKTKQIERKLTKFGEKWLSFLQFEAWIKTKKKAILFHPDYVLMTWEQFRSLTKEEKPKIIRNELIDELDIDAINNLSTKDE